MEKNTELGTKIVAILLAGVFLFGIFSAVGFSSDNETVSGLSPDNPFYFMKRWGEGLKIAFAKAELKAELRQEFAAERLKEAKFLYMRNLTARAEKFVLDAEREIEESAREAERRESENRTIGLENALLRHEENLERFSLIVASVCANETSNSSQKCSALTKVEEKMGERNERFEAVVNKSAELRERIREKLDSSNLTEEQKIRLRIRIADKREDIRDRIEDLRDRAEDRREERRERIIENRTNLTGLPPRMPALNGTSGPKDGSGEGFRDEVSDDNPSSDDGSNSSSSGAGKKLSQLYDYAGVKTFVYRTESAGVKTDISYSVSSGTIDGKSAWIHTTETDTRGVKSSTSTYLDKATLGCLKITSTVNAMGQVIENNVDCPTSGPDAPKASEPYLEYKGTETLTVPAGTYSADKYEIESSGIEYFVASGVPIPVKVEYLDSEMKLVSWS